MFKIDFIDVGPMFTPGRAMLEQFQCDDATPNAPKNQHNTNPTNLDVKVLTIGAAWTATHARMHARTHARGRATKLPLGKEEFQSMKALPCQACT